MNPEMVRAILKFFTTKKRVLLERRDCYRCWNIKNLYNILFSVVSNEIFHYRRCITPKV